MSSLILRYLVSSEATWIFAWFFLLFYFSPNVLRRCRHDEGTWCRFWDALESQSSEFLRLSLCSPCEQEYCPQSWNGLLCSWWTSWILLSWKFWTEEILKSIDKESLSFFPPQLFLLLKTNRSFHSKKRLQIFLPFGPHFAPRLNSKEAVAFQWENINRLARIFSARIVLRLFLNYSWWFFFFLTSSKDSIHLLWLYLCGSFSFFDLFFFRISRWSCCLTSGEDKTFLLRRKENFFFKIVFDPQDISSNRRSRHWIGIRVFQTRSVLDFEAIRLEAEHPSKYSRIRSFLFPIEEPNQTLMIAHNSERLIGQIASKILDPMVYRQAFLLCGWIIPFGRVKWSTCILENSFMTTLILRQDCSDLMVARIGVCGG